jgi:proteic killer suppression protein
MIRSFSNRNLERFFVEGDGRRLPVREHAKLLRLLDKLHAAVRPEDMRDIKNFHKLTGVERWAVNVTPNYRLTWGWLDGPVDVDIEDYH